MSDAISEAGPEKARSLTPANQNPWYVLMTLYGEQKGKKIDWELHEKNRDAWNAWACSTMTDEEKAKAVLVTGVPLVPPKFTSSFILSLETLHKSEMLKRNGEGFNYQGIPDPSAQYDMTQLTFEEKVVMERFMFRNLLNMFENSFTETLRLRRAFFAGPANFLLCTFENGLNAPNCHFSGSTSFHGTVFKGLACLNLTKFASTIEFTSVDFFKGADFETATFSGVAHFQDSTFDCSSVKPSASLSFMDCHFEKPANFQRSRFCKRFPNLTGTVFHDRTHFTASQEYWPDDDQKEILIAKGACATVRHIQGKQGLPDEEHFFYRKEMYFTQLAATNPFEKVSYWLFGALADYGYSFLKPAISLLAVFAFGLVANWGYLLSGSGQIGGFGSAFAVSFSNMFPFFGFGRQFGVEEIAKAMPPALKTIGGAQTVFSTVLLFLFALGLRTRFRMR